MKQLLFLLFSISSLAWSQNYVYTETSTGAEKVTFQQPVNGARLTQFQGLYIYCPTSCAISLSRDGSVASTTAGTITNLNATEAVAKTAVFTASNVGVGTVIGTYSLAGGSSMVIDLSGKYLKANTRENFTIQTDVACSIIVTFLER